MVEDIKPKKTLNNGEGAEEVIENRKDEDQERRDVAKTSIREWAARQEPKLVEGEDFIVEQLREGSRPGEQIAPHEMTNIYFVFKASSDDVAGRWRFQAVRTFFENEYAAGVADFKKPWSREVEFNYSWAGRFLVTGAGGPAIDTGPVESFKPEPVCKTHHSEFKSFFESETGLKFPTVDDINTATERAAEHFDWYAGALNALKEKRAAAEVLARTNSDVEFWKYDDAITDLEYILIILKDAKKINDAREALRKMEHLGSSEGILLAQTELENAEKRKLRELPDNFIDDGKTDKIRHYNDLTYNIDDRIDLDRINQLLDGEFAPPEETGARIDKIFEEFNGFDRKKMEELCRKFSVKLYG